MRTVLLLESFDFRIVPNLEVGVIFFHRVKAGLKFFQAGGNGFFKLIFCRARPFLCGRKLVLRRREPGGTRG